MASLSASQITLTRVGGDVVKVRTQVTVNFNAFEKFMMSNGLQVAVSCRIWGEDSGFNGADDNLFSMGSKSAGSGGGAIVFERSVAKDWLDEDIGTDEIYARFTLNSASPGIIASVTSRSPTKTGSF